MITVIVPVMTERCPKTGNPNRSLDRLDYNLRSIVNQQKHLKSLGVLLEVIVVNHHKDERITTLFRATSEANKCRFLNINTTLVFNKSYLINVGAKEALGEYIAISELDMIFRKDLLFRMYTKLTGKKSIIITHNFYLNDKKSLKRINLNCNKSFSGLYNFGFVKPNIEAKAEGGLQLFRKKNFCSLGGYNTGINLIGGYDNEAMNRFRLSGYKTELHYPDVKKIFSVHIPHEKFKFNNISKGFVNKVRYSNKNIINLNKKKIPFVCNDDDVQGVRLIDNKYVFGTDNKNVSMNSFFKKIKMEK